MNKKGSEMTIGTIIFIVLALVVLIVLVVGFTTGWGNLWSRITGFFGKPNVDSVVQACSVACTTDANFDYCQRQREVRFEDTGSFKFTCYQLEAVSGTGLARCGGIDCSAQDSETCTKSLGEWKTSACKSAKEDFTSKVLASSEAGNLKGSQFCCNKTAATPAAEKPAA